MRVFLVGFMGCGKSTVGRSLADRLGYSFVDSDEHIESVAGMSVRELFEKRGEAAFRALEVSFVQEWMPATDTVVSLGGGLPCHHQLMHQLKALGKVIYLKTTPFVLAQRLTQERENRPLLRDLAATDLLPWIETKLATREPVYRQAHAEIDTDAATVEMVVNAALQLLC